jgi:DNA polymerase III subunit epsilon
VSTVAYQQRSLEDLGAPLHDVTFCVIDLETTGGSRHSDAITEVAAVRYRGGQRLDSFVTLVNPGVPIPPTITYLTGITEDMVGPAPTIEPVLAALMEFVRADDVIVGHNVGFDIGFLNAGLVRNGWPRLTRRVVDTVRLARRLVRDEVPNCKLGTLASWLGLAHQPCHRALADVEATADLLHLFLERVSGLGITGLDDLLELPTISGHPQASKLGITAGLPRRPGVYIFRDRGGTVIYVGKATNLRARVRQYFGGDDRRKVGPMMQVLHRIEHIECSSPIEAAIIEIRLIQRFRPRFNRVATLPEKYAYLRVSGTAGSPKLTVTKNEETKTGWLLGPVHSTSSAHTLAEALTDACRGLDPTTALDEQTVLNCAGDLLAPFADRLLELSQEGSYEQAAAMRDRAALLSRTIARQQRARAIAAVPTLRLRWVRQGLSSDLTFSNSRLVVKASGATGTVSAVGTSSATPTGPTPAPQTAAHQADIARRNLDEITILTTFLDRFGHQVRLLDSPIDSNVNTAGIPKPGTHKLGTHKPGTQKPSTPKPSTPKPAESSPGLAWPVHRAASFDPRNRSSRPSASTRTRSPTTDAVTTVASLDRHAGPGPLLEQRLVTSRYEPRPVAHGPAHLRGRNDRRGRGRNRRELGGLAAQTPSRPQPAFNGTLALDCEPEPPRTPSSTPPLGDHPGSAREFAPRRRTR